MASGCCSGLFYLWIILLSSDLDANLISPTFYFIHQQELPFEQAVKACSSGVLTPLATQQEVNEVLRVVSSTVEHQSNFTFWVGLKKANSECDDPTLPLRGYKWIDGSSEKSQVIPWAQEPETTCISVRCAALTGEFNGSAVTRWGLLPVTCKKPYRYICKQTALIPAAPEPKPTSPESTKPATQKPEPLTPGLKLPTKPEPDTDLNSTTGPALMRPQPGSGSKLMLGSDSCQHPVIPESRSLSLDPNNSSKIQVECWSSYQLELHCRGHPAMWHLPDDSPANFTTICQKCEAGLQKDASGKCVDINKCSNRGNAPCNQTCLNTEGSHGCVCSGESGKHHGEGSAVCTDLVTAEDSGLLSEILIPVLVAVAVLVVLVVVVAVAVKCCLMRSSKKRAMKKAEKMAMKNKVSRDSFATANEKTAT